MSRRWSLPIVVVLAGLCLVVAVAAAQKIYKWTDSDGKVHFSNVAPGRENASADTSGVKGVEVENPAAPPAVPPPVAENETGAPAAPSAGVSSESSISEEAFSAKVSITRTRLKRELAQAKEESQSASEKLDALRKERDRPARVGLELLQKAYGPEKHESSEEDELRKQKDKADGRAEEIRKEYAALHDEAVKRFGGQPAWWLPIE